MNDVISLNDEKSWQNLANFARCAIGSSKRGSKKKRSQATILNSRLESFMAGSQEVPLTKARNPPSLKQQVSSKMSQGDIQGSI